MSLFRFISSLLIFSLLTLFTQVGGIIWLAGRFITQKLPHERWFPNPGWWSSFALRITFYFVVTFFVVPPLARAFGRVPLPTNLSGALKPRTILTVVFNRHYVRPELRSIAISHAEALSARHPGLQVNYFDANFPFALRFPFAPYKKGFPLLPHLSHSDGKKLDIGFIYRNADDGRLSPRTPSAIGYGISEEPLPGEYDRPRECRASFSYNFMRNIWPQGAKDDYHFDTGLTHELIAAYARDKQIGKIFLEPHLKTRLSLAYGKISGVQCEAVRHDDHFHIQLY